MCCRRNSLLVSKYVNTTKTKVLFELGTRNRNNWNLKRPLLKNIIVKNKNASYFITDLTNHDS